MSRTVPLIVSATRTGTSHQACGIPCQDRVRHRLTRDGLMAAAVADGAGSSEKAQVGAQTAARAAVRSLTGTEAPDGLELLMRGAARDARTALEETARRENHPLRDYHTTLILAVDTGARLGALQIGDGGIVTMDREGRISLAAQPQQGEYANETSFVTDEDSDRTAEVMVTEAHGTTHLALFSDGLQRLLLDYSTGVPRPHEPFFRKTFRWLDRQTDQRTASQGLAKLLASPAVTSRTQDDTSLIIARMR